MTTRQVSTFGRTYSTLLVYMVKKQAKKKPLKMLRNAKKGVRSISSHPYIGRKIKAAILQTIDAPLVVGHVELTELMFGQVLVKILASGICGAQLLEIGGHKGNAKFVPHLLGHEGVGIVEEVGIGVSRVKKGDKVIMHWRKGEGIEADFPTYVYNGKPMRSGKVTTFSEYSIVSENRLTPVPQETPNELCALLGCGLSTALGTIKDEANVRFGESVMVVGAGGLGLNMVKAATLASAYPIISIDINDHKRELAKQLGAHLFINSSTHNIADELLNNFGIKEVDVIIETPGNTRALRETIPFLSGVGRFIMVGQPKPGETVELLNANHMFGGEGKMVKATQGGKFSPSHDIPRYVRLHKAGILDIDNIITHKIKLEQVNEAIELVRKGQASRILIEM
jgi:S-(hydroxymethyl)glutathione dehydrogenase / alcohol dehydrogenase